MLGTYVSSRSQDWHSVLKGVGLQIGRTATAAILSVFAQSAVLAQNDSGAGEAANASSVSIDEILITARKREESLQETPIAITALSGEQLRNRSVTNLMEVGSFARSEEHTSELQSH